MATKRQDDVDEEVEGNGVEDEEEPTYERLAKEEPERLVNIAKVEVSKEAAGDSEDEVVTRSDSQAAMNAITPRYKDKRMAEVLQPILVSRVFPDNYLDLNYFAVMSMIEEHEGEADIDFLSIVTGVQSVTSKAYEGRHIIDILEIAGLEKEEEINKLSQQLGLG